MGGSPVRFSRSEIEFLEAEGDIESVNVHNAYWAAQDNLSKFRDVDYREADKQYDEYREGLTQKLLEDQRTAYHKIISEIRDTGGTVEASFSSPETGEMIQKTINTYYPTEWIEKSNSSERKMLIDPSENRAFYSHSPIADDAWDGETETVPSFGAAENLNITFMKTIPEFPTQAQTQEFDNTLTKLTAFNNFVELIKQDPSYKVIEREMQTFNTDYGSKVINVLKTNLEHMYDPDIHGPLDPSTNQPVGEGWEYKTAMDMGKLHRILKDQPGLEIPEIFQKLSEKQWVKKQTTTTIKKNFSLLTFPEVKDEGNKNPESREAVLLHEMAHRAESTNPVIPKLEKAFISRRANKTDETWHDNMIPALGIWDTQEYAHDGGFVTPYVGKEYPNSSSYEVLSVGIESIYGGNNGGLVGASRAGERNKADLNHRGFVLGLLASA